MFISLKFAIQALKSNKLRTGLTVIGVVIGIATVIIVMSLGSVTEQLIVGQVESFGSNTIFAEIKVPSKKSIDMSEGSNLMEGVSITSLKEEDAKAIQRQISNVKSVYSANMGEEIVTSRNKKLKSALLCVNASYVNIDKSKVEEGRFFTEDENMGLARAAVLGSEIKTELFGDENPIGQYVRVKGVNFRVVGVMAKRGAVMFMNMDKQVYLPIKTAQKLVLGIDFIRYFVVQVKDEALIYETAEQMKTILRKRHNITINDGSKDDFRVTTTEEAMSMMTAITGGVQILLLILAAISLLVGGVGIMNIMYVIVTERTKEIGLRKALGAKKKNILLQFLLEAIMITGAGGVIGIIGGSLVCFLVTVIANSQGLEFSFFVSLSGILISVLAAVLEGVLFGLYPAQKAARMNAIEALRSD